MQQARKPAAYTCPIQQGILTAIMHCTAPKHCAVTAGISLCRTRRACSWGMVGWWRIRMGWWRSSRGWRRSRRGLRRIWKWRNVIFFYNGLGSCVHWLHCFFFFFLDVVYLSKSDNITCLGNAHSEDTLSGNRVDDYWWLLTDPSLCCSRAADLWREGVDYRESSIQVKWNKIKT